MGICLIGMGRGLGLGIGGKGDFFEGWGEILVFFFLLFFWVFFGVEKKGGVFGCLCWGEYVG